MIESLQFLAAPFALAILLVLIHSYLGLHIIERDVIFVDISLSQVAALGAAISAVLFHEEESWSLFVSLGLCCIVSVLLAVFRKIEKKISQETIIGITYALASGLLVLVLDQSPHGSEHLKSSLIGNLLFTTWDQVALVGAVYAGIALIHFVFRKKFWESTRAENNSVAIDILFYLLFSIVITFSTHHAGVLVVFAALVVPAALAAKKGGSVRQRLLNAWLFGIVAATLSFALSTKLDWPIGAGIVVTFTTLFFATISLQFLKSGRT